MQMKALGFNTLRKHIKVEPLIFYHLCDKLGMVVFQDFVNNSTYNFLRDTAFPHFFPRANKLDTIPLKNKQVFVQSMLATYDHLCNCPSICYWTVFNEGWGQFATDDVVQYLINKTLA